MENQIQAAIIRQLHNLDGLTIVKDELTIEIGAIIEKGDKVSIYSANTDMIVYVCEDTKLLKSSVKLLRGNRSGDLSLPELVNYGRFVFENCEFFYALTKRISRVTLEDYFKDCGQKLPINAILSIGLRVLQVIQHVHR